jgi:iron complex outermembrane receptor protein
MTALYRYPVFSVRNPLKTVAFFLLISSSLADQKAQAAADLTGSSRQKDSTIEEVVVRAHPLSAEGLAQSTISLSGDALARNLAPNLGETLGNQPGIHSSSFGAAVGRPVIHGQSGARVLVMEDRLSTMDVSVTSGDHATTIEPFIADSIEVLKGPATLLYGNGAVGGVVDVHTGRVPHGQQEARVSGRITAQGSDNGDQHAIAGRFDGRQNRFFWHVDGFDRRSSNYDIPGETESAALIAQEEAEAAANNTQHEEEHESAGFLPGSHFDTDGGAIGLSYADDHWFAGIALSQLNAVYGLPGGHGHEDEAPVNGAPVNAASGEESSDTPILDLEQTRVDFEIGGANPWSGATDTWFGRAAHSVESLNLRIGTNDYEHAEIEPSGEVATFFQNDAVEARFEVTHDLGGNKHVWGVQLSDRDFSVTGEEAFVPGVDSRNTGVFWLSEQMVNDLALEMGLRFERVEHKAQEVAAQADFTTAAGSLGVIHAINTDLTLTANFGYAQRAPVGEELFSDGPHLATGRYEIGTATLDEETVYRMDVILGWAKDGVELNLNAYYATFDDYIYQNATGGEEDQLPVFVWDQADADFYGLDGELRWQSIEIAGGNLTLRAFFDLIRSSLDTSAESELPLMPADRLGLSLTQRWGDVALTLEAKRVADQDDVPSYQLATQGYNDIDAHLEWQPQLTQAQNLVIFLRGENLSDDEQRHHTSFIKDTAPQRGRTWTLGARYQF